MRDVDDSKSSPRKLGENHFQHGRRPFPVMADDDPAWPGHAEDMPGIELPLRHLCVVRIDAPQDKTIIQPGDGLAHCATEEAASRAEVPRRWCCWTAVNLLDLCLDGPDLSAQFVLGKTKRWFITHSVVGQLVAIGKQLSENVFATRDVRADEEERGFCAVGVEDLVDCCGAWGGSVVDGQG